MGGILRLSTLIYRPRIVPPARLVVLPCGGALSRALIGRL